MGNFEHDALARAEEMLINLRIEVADCNNALNLFLDIDSTFRSASLQIVHELVETESHKRGSMARAVLAARLALGEKFPTND